MEAVVTFLVIGWLLLGVSVMVGLAHRHNYLNERRNYVDFKAAIGTLLQRQVSVMISPEQVQHIATLISGAMKDKERKSWIN